MKRLCDMHHTKEVEASMWSKVVSQVSLLRLVLVFLLLAPGSGPLQGRDQAVLDNGLLRLIFDERTKVFEVRPLSSRVVRLFDAGPSFQKDGQMVSVADAEKIETRRESFKDQIGQ